MYKKKKEKVSAIKTAFESILSENGLSPFSLPENSYGARSTFAFLEKYKRQDEDCFSYIALELGGQRIALYQMRNDLAKNIPTHPMRESFSAFLTDSGKIQFSFPFGNPYLAENNIFIHLSWIQKSLLKTGKFV